VAPDIAALDKPLGRRCVHLGEDLLCTIYETRPTACRNYQADAFCTQIASDTIEGRVRNYLQAFGLEDEARIADGAESMREARRLKVLP
jgi:uncharacterized protein